MEDLLKTVLVTFHMQSIILENYSQYKKRKVWNHCLDANVATDSFCYGFMLCKDLDG